MKKAVKINKNFLLLKYSFHLRTKFTVSQLFTLLITQNLYTNVKFETKQNFSTNVEENGNEGFPPFVHGCQGNLHLVPAPRGGFEVGGNDQYDHRRVPDAVYYVGRYVLARREVPLVKTNLPSSCGFHFLLTEICNFF